LLSRLRAIATSNQLTGNGANIPLVDWLVMILGTDKVVLDKTTFTVLRSTASSGFSIAGELASVADNAAAVSSAYITYSRATGSLFYNQNGSDSGLRTGGEFANLSGLPNLTAADFMIQT
jgi:hypothetical protein